MGAVEAASVVDAAASVGVPEDAVRTVTENAAVLKFEAGSGFEEE